MRHVGGGLRSSVITETCSVLLNHRLIYQIYGACQSAQEDLLLTGSSLLGSIGEFLPGGISAPGGTFLGRTNRIRRIKATGTLPR